MRTSLCAALVAFPLLGACFFSPATLPCRTEQNCPDERACIDGTCAPAGTSPDEPAPRTDAGDERDDAGTDEDAGIDVDPGGDDAGSDAGVDAGASDAGLDEDDAGIVDAGVDEDDAGEGCASIAGDLVVTGDDTIPSLLPDGDGCVVVQGSLRVNGFHGASLGGLERVASIGADLVIDQNGSLQDVAALWDVESVGGDFAVTANPSLPTCAAHNLHGAIDVVAGTAVWYGNLADACEEQLPVDSGG